MAALTIKNIPEELYENLKISASANRRSINGELIHCLEKVLQPKKVTSEEHLAAARNLRQRISKPIPIKDIDDAKNVGRK